VVVAMNAVTQAESAVLAGDRYRAHDLAHLAAAAEQVALARHPHADVGGIAAELAYGEGLQAHARAAEMRLKR